MPKKPRLDPLPKRPPVTWVSLRADSLRCATTLQLLISSAEKKDRALSEQLARAVTHLVLELSRADAHEGSAGRLHLLAALASASEAMILLRLVVDHRHCSWPRAKPAYDELSALIHALLKRADPRRVRAKRPSAAA
jgi:hypothetical protein